jgi:hypothetical protein
METILEDFHRSYRWRVSPYQLYLNNQGKQEIISNLKLQVNYIWATPVALTIYYLFNLNNPNKNIRLAMYLSYLLAFGCSRFAIWRTKIKLSELDNLYPKPPQIQLEMLKNVDILKAHMNI